MLKTSSNGGGAVRAPAAPATAAPATPPVRPPSVARRERPAAGGALALVRSSSLPALVQKELERMILSAELPAGSKLNEADLAARLGVSRGPVREAFRALEESGLVRLEKNRGVFVRRVPVEEADEIYELRAVLDEFVGRRLAQTATPDVVCELRGRVERMERAAAKRDVDAYLAANVAFHDRLVELAGNAKLLGTYRRLVNELHLFRHTTLAQMGALPVSTREHRDIVERIASGRPAAAGRALHDHVMASRERMHRARDAAVAAAARAARAASDRAGAARAGTAELNPRKPR
jgi:phosphonate utilization transcriptional regulator